MNKRQCGRCEYDIDENEKYLELKITAVRNKDSQKETGDMGGFFLCQSCAGLLDIYCLDDAAEMLRRAIHDCYEYHD